MYMYFDPCGMTVNTGLLLIFCSLFIDCYGRVSMLVSPCPSLTDRTKQCPRTTRSDQLNKVSIETLYPGSRQLAVEAGRDGLAGLRDVVVVVVHE